MKRIVLFSQPTENNVEKVVAALFPKELENKVMAYMPADGRLTKQKYTDYWLDLATRNNSEFIGIMKESGCFFS